MGPYRAISLAGVCVCVWVCACVSVCVDGYEGGLGEYGYGFPGE